MLDTIEATEAQHTALDHLKGKQAALDDFVESEKSKLRRKRKADEKRRVDAVKSGKEKAGAKRTSISTIVEGGRERKVKRIRTTSNRMADLGTLPPELKSALDEFAVLVADGLGAATLDEHEASSRLTASYDGGGGGSFGSKTLSDRQLDGLAAFNEMKSRMPDELMPVFLQLMGEEVGIPDGRADRLKDIGDHWGYTHKQASAAGGMMVICICTLVRHYLRDRSVTTELSQGLMRDHFKPTPRKRKTAAS